MIGSDTPARSLFSTTSEYVAPVATILLSSSERAIQLPKGANRNASRRAAACGDIVKPQKELDAKDYLKVSFDAR
jgi:hypothetical protein